MGRRTPQCTRRTIRSIPVVYVRRYHLDELGWNSGGLHTASADTRRRVGIRSVTPAPHDGTACRKNALVAAGPEFVYASANAEGMNPPLDNKDVCICAIRYREKWIGAEHTYVTDREQDQDKNHPSQPRETPAFFPFQKSRNSLPRGLPENPWAFH